MSDAEDQDPNAVSASRDAEGAAEDSRVDPGETAPRDIARRSDAKARTALAVVLPPPSWDERRDEPRRRFRAASLSRRVAAAAALAFAVVGLAVAAYVALDIRRQDALLAERAKENGQLAETVSALSARLQAVETAKGRDELADLRRSIGDMKTTAATSRELSAALADLSQRVEKLDREQGARLNKLGELDRETNARAAEFSARLDKLEKKPAAPPPAPPPEPPKLGPNVAMEPTGSIMRPRQVVRGYVVLDAEGDTALVGGRYGERAVRPGDWLPGAGRVERVQRRGSNWVVVTDQGLIASAYAAPD